MPNDTLDPCGCCEGDDSLTPADIYNRPALDAIQYRIGTHAAFFETMIAQLSREEIVEQVVVGVDSEDKAIINERRYRPLDKLTTRSRDDFSIALLDAWATVADVLTFYQERIANEGYLRTATERRSILELARLIGYELRPGVAATTYLAFIVETAEKLAHIPAGTRAQSIPQPGEIMQSFETAEDITAWASWNEIGLRMSMPQFIVPFGVYQGENRLILPANLYLPGAQMAIGVGDVLLLHFSDERYYRATVGATTIDSDSKHTRITISSALDVQSGSEVIIDTPSSTSPAPIRGDWFADEKLVAMRLRPLVTVANKANLPIDPTKISSQNQGLQLQTLSIIEPQLGEVLATVVRSTIPGVIGKQAMLSDLFASVATASLFGANSPGKPKSVPDRGDPPDGTTTVVFDPWLQTDVNPSNLFSPVPSITPNGEVTAPSSPVNAEVRLTLDQQYSTIQIGAFVLLEWLDQANSSLKRGLYRVKSVRVISASIFNQTSKATQLQLIYVLGDNWIGYVKHIPATTATVFRQLAHDVETGLALGREPIKEPLDATQDGMIELDGLYDGLKPGRWLAITGTRTDIPVVARELAMIKNVEHKYGEMPVSNNPYPGDTRHTFVELATPLNYTYVRDSVRINANVAKATHGESVQGSPLSGGAVVLGSGDAAQPNQHFELRLQPGARLTYVPAPTRDGVASTLEVRINEVRWDAARTLIGVEAKDQAYVVMTADDGKTEVITGDGNEGARVPTGGENVRARYRVGIGKPGNVKAGQISLLATRPPGVREVINPLASTGGADPESRDTARRNAPLSVRTLDRLVGLQDYADFARTFAGIGKAVASAPTTTYRFLRVVVAGEDNIPLNEGSDIVRNLRRALDEFDGSNLRIDVDIYTPRLLYLAVNAQVLPAYLWELVQPRLHAALLAAFSFQKRDLGQDLALSEVLAVIYSVEGIAQATVTAFAALSSKDVIALAAGTSVQALPPPAPPPPPDSTIPPPPMDGDPILPSPPPLPPPRLVSFKPVSLISIALDELVYADPAVPELLILNEVKQGAPDDNK